MQERVDSMLCNHSAMTSSTTALLLTTLSIFNTEHYDLTIIDAEFQYTLTVIISSVILESVILLSVITLTVIMLNFIILIDIVHLC